MGLVRSITRRMLDQVARRVAQDDLFEKPGERAHTPPLKAAAPVTPGRGFGGKLGSPVQAADLQSIQERLRGGGIRIAHHWATWCEGCVEELPLVEELHSRVHGNAQVVGVSWERSQDQDKLEDSVERVRAFSEKAGISFPSLVATVEPEDLFEGLGLDFQQIPQTRVLGSDGQELLSSRGPMQRADVDRIVSLVEAT